jgi:hypothetical protein
LFLLPLKGGAILEDLDREQAMLNVCPSWTLPVQVGT